MRSVLPLLPVALALCLVALVGIAVWRMAERGELPVLHLRAGR